MDKFPGDTTAPPTYPLGGERTHAEWPDTQCEEASAAGLAELRAEVDNSPAVKWNEGFWGSFLAPWERVRGEKDPMILALYELSLDIIFAGSADELLSKVKIWRESEAVQNFLRSAGIADAQSFLAFCASLKEGAGEGFDDDLISTVSCALFGTDEEVRAEIGRVFTWIKQVHGDVAAVMTEN